MRQGAIMHRPVLLTIPKRRGSAGRNSPKRCSGCSTPRWSKFGPGDDLHGWPITSLWWDRTERRPLIKDFRGCDGNSIDRNMIVTGSILFLDTSKYVPEHIHIML